MTMRMQVWMCRVSRNCLLRDREGCEESHPIDVGFCMWCVYSSPSSALRADTTGGFG